MEQILTLLKTDIGINTSITIVLLVGYLVMTKKLFPVIEEQFNKSGFKGSSLPRAYHTTRILTLVSVVVAILFIWGIDFGGLVLLSTSIITLTGVALFANWSLLSNITSYFVLIFNPDFKRGNYIRILESDNFIEGYIADVGLFNTRLISEDREILNYPNNLVVGRPTVINPREKLGTFGKLSDATKAKTALSKEVN